MCFLEDAVYLTNFVELDKLEWVKLGLDFYEL